MVGGHFVKGAYILDQALSFLFSSSQISKWAKFNKPGLQIPLLKYSVFTSIDSGCRKLTIGITVPLSLTTSSSALYNQRKTIKYNLTQI